MKMWTKCPISRLPNLGVGLFEAQQVNSDSQIVFKRQNILVCAQNVNEGKKWILSSFLPFKDLKTPALWSMQNNVEKDRDSPPPTIRLLNYANQWSALGRWIIVSNIGGRFCELYKEEKVKNTFEVNLSRCNHPNYQGLTLLQFFCLMTIARLSIWFFAVVFIFALVDYPTQNFNEHNPVGTDQSKK